MADIKDHLDKLRARIEAQNGTVLDVVEGEIELDDADGNGQPRKGPVLVLRSIEAGAQLKLARPRPVTVLGSLSGQVLGAYRVKAGNLLSGHLEGCRHVEIVNNMGSNETSDEESRIVFEATSDPGFFDQAKQSLQRLQKLDKHQIPLREATARGILMRGLKEVPYKVRVSVDAGNKQSEVFAPSPNGQSIKLDLMTLLSHLLSKADCNKDSPQQDEIARFKVALDETIAASLRQANSGGIGANLRKTRGEDVYRPQVELIADYLLPKLLNLWLKASEAYLERVIDGMKDAPMILKVDGQLAPCFQIEYPRLDYRVASGRIETEKVADCTITCKLGSDPENAMSLTYTYVNGDNSITQTKEIALEKGKACKLILQNGHVFLTETNNHLFGPATKENV